MLDNYLKQLNDLDTRMASLGYMQALMGWDSMTLASKKGIDARSAVSANISELSFNTLINDQVKTMLDALDAQKEALNDLDQAKLTYYTKAYHQIAKIPVDEYAAYSALCAKSNLVWEEAKEKNDYSLFAPYLKEVLDTQKRFVTYRGYEGHPYNTLLDDYEPGLTVEVADRFFQQLKEAIVPLVKQIQEKGHMDFDFLHQNYAIADQEKFSKHLMEILGFRMDSGTIAVSAHPFSMNLSREDVRITTHYYADNLVSSIFSTIHETGHALYEQNIAADIGLSALASGVSMGIHESQSRIYENNFGRNLHFWKAHYPELQAHFPELKNISLTDFHKALNIVNPSLIRIEADEVTYPLHIMVRYEMEKFIMSEDYDINELPKLWADKYEEYLGIRPQNDAEGILQDVHWSDGLFGYFPSYALGSAYAAQFEHYLRKDLDLDLLLQEGKMQEILGWLSEKIHRFGSTKTPAQIIRSATGEDFNPKYFIDYLENKYRQIYS